LTALCDERQRAVPASIDAATLARALQSNTVPAGLCGHFERFLGEVPLSDVLRFCDRHAIPAPTLARYVRTHRQELALRHPALEEHLDALVPSA